MQKQSIADGPMGSLYVYQNSTTLKALLMKVIDASSASHAHYWDKLSFTSNVNRLDFMEPSAATGNTPYPHIGIHKHDNILWVGEKFSDHLELEYFEDGHPLFSDDSRELDALSREDRLAVLDQIAAAVDHAHQFGLIHGNLCPQNILFRMSDRQIKIADFFGYGTAMVEPYNVNKYYRAPEWTPNGAITKQWDYYAFAVIALRLLLGQAAGTFHLEIENLKRSNQTITPQSDWKVCLQSTLANDAPERTRSCTALLDCVRSTFKKRQEVPREQGPNEVWIENTILARVDDKGYLIDAWSEGVFGCVLKIESRDNVAKTNFALKVPRLLADTSIENDFICRLMDIEVDAVWRASRGNGVGLMSTRSINPHPLRGARTLNRPTSRCQDGHFLLMSFPKNRPPRMCNVAWKQSLSVFPESLLPEMEKVFPDSSLLKELESNFDTTVAFESPSISDAGESGEEKVIWYAGLPATIFNWAPITLQEALLQNYTASWHIEDYSHLFLRILTGLKALHNSSPRLLHGDLRPANILCFTTDLNDAQPHNARTSEPAHYNVADYGSFSVALYDGALSLGPVVGRYRKSPFYSPERRAAEESESANVALIVEISEPEPSYAVCLGWRSMLTDPETGRAKQSAIHAIRNALATEEALPAGGAGVDIGDSLRLRNYVFRVKGIKTSKDVGEIYICDRRIATVMQERLSAYLPGSALATVDTLNLPNYSILKRPTPAVDLFSFGAVTLYCLFASSSPVSDERQKDEERNTTLDEAFAGTMAILESKPYLNVLWRDCEAIRAYLDDLRKTFMDTTKPASDAPHVRFKIPSSLKLEGQGSDEEKEIYDLTKQVANNILQSTPHISWILEKLDYNLAKFVLMVQFVLSCLHYADDLSPDHGQEGSSPMQLPICRNRKHAEDHSVINDLEHRFVDLFHSKNTKERSLFDCAPCQEFVMPHAARRTELLTYNPRSDVFFRIEHTRLLILKDEVNARNTLLVAQKKDLQVNVGQLNQEVGELKERVKGFEKRLGEAAVKIEDAKKTTDRLRSVEKKFAELESTMFKLKNLAKGLPTTFMGNYQMDRVKNLIKEIGE